MGIKPILWFLVGFAAVAALTVVLSARSTAATGTGNSITAPDDGGAGVFTSLELDTNGNPVVSYTDAVNLDLKILHCNDSNCSGGGESIRTVDSSGVVGYFPSLALDGAGYPVVSYKDHSNGRLKILHCNDANCANGDESFATADSATSIGSFTSLVLDNLGFPVVAYYDGTSEDLKILHCNDSNCSGAVESITSPDTVGRVGYTGSLALDGSGNPVVSYYDVGNGDLKILHCNDVNCAVGGDSMTSPDSVNDVGLQSSLVLDGGNPLVAYYDGSNGDLKVLRCDDVNCSGGGESITSPDTLGTVGVEPSLALDAAGIPVVSYRDFTNDNLNVLHCGDTTCSSSNVISSPDNEGNVGQSSSLQIDGSGNPVVSYVGANPDDMRILHCVNPTCSGPAKPSPTPTVTPTSTPTPTPPCADFDSDTVCDDADVDDDGDGCSDTSEQQTGLGSQTSGGLRDYLNPNDYFNPTHDGMNRVDDILRAVEQYFKDAYLDPPGNTIPNPDYTSDTDRTLLGPYVWSLGPPDGLQRVDDILNQLKQYFHDCS